MATTRITIESLGNAQIKFTVNKVPFIGFYGEPLRKRVAQAALEQAHFDEIFSISIKSDTQPGLNAELLEFKNILKKGIADLEAEQLNLTIEGEDGSQSVHLKGSEDMQRNILKQAKVVADNITAPGQISLKDRQINADKCSDADLVKAKAQVESYAQRGASDAGGIGVAATLVGSISILFTLIFAPLVVSLVPAAFIVLGVFSLAIAASESNTFQKTDRSKLLLNLRRLNPEFLTRLEASTPQPASQAEIGQPHSSSVPTPPLSPAQPEVSEVRSLDKKP